MKKLLLLAALAASYASASAEGFSDIFTLTYEGEAIADGATVTVPYYYDPIVKEYPELAGVMDPSYESKAEIFATNNADEPMQFEFSLNVESPSAEDFAANEAYGNYQLCYYFESGSGNCMSSEALKDFYYPNDPVSSEEYIRMDVDQIRFTELAPVTLKLGMRVMDEETEVGSSTIYIKFTHESDITAAVEGISADTNAEYFTIQGIRVAAPQKGQLYIERKNGKVAKRIF